MKQKILAFLGTMLLAGGLFTIMTPTPAMALGGGDCGAPHVLGLRPWFDGLCSGTEIQTPSGGDSTDEVVKFVWIVVLNVLFDVVLVVGYLAIGFIVYGGFLYITAQGDPARALKGQKTLTAAIIGTIIAMAASVIVNTIKVVLGISGSGWKQDYGGSGFANEQVLQALNWAYTVAGIVAVIFIIKAGVEYVISRGDPSKTQKAMRGIIYPLVGLVIVLLAAAISNFIIGAASNSLQEETSLILEERYEKIDG